MNSVRITVLKREFYADLAEQFLSEGASVGACPLQEVGDVFLYSGGAEKPEGLCPWAWIGLLRNDLRAVLRRGRKHVVSLWRHAHPSAARTESAP